MSTKPLLLCALVTSAIAACGNDHALPPPPFDAEARRAFIEKVHRALHPSALPLPHERVDSLLHSSDEDIIAALYQDPETIDAVLHVSLSFLGAPVDELHAGGRWAPETFAYLPAAGAARAFSAGGDPLTGLFTTKPKPAMGSFVPVREDVLAFYYPVPPLQGTPADRRAYVEKLVRDDVASFRSFVAGQPDPLPVVKVCNQANAAMFQFIPRDLPNILGVPDTLVFAGHPPEVDDPALFGINQLCGTGGKISRATMLASVDATATVIDALFTRLDALFAHWESSPNTAFDELDVAALGWVPDDFGTPAVTQFYPQFWQLALDSSTNYNRRRGAYALDRYFCDDLKPVGAALPTDHVGNKHATDPACAACHFKLDPMAGYFRRHGFSGTEFTDELLAQSGNQITFDDGASIDFTQYESAWKAPPGSGREFDVGYIRSTSDTSLNSYGNNLDDLDMLLQTAPEVERCFVKRAFQYFNGEDQAVDPGFLDDVATDAHAAGAGRFQRTVTRILSSETFKADSRNTNVCYDLAPGADPDHRPPCEVASTLAAHCTSCHGGPTPQSGLDLSRWERGADGKYGFTDVVDGVPVDRVETLRRMLDRLVTSDLQRQMPFAQNMPLRAREDLVLWVQSMIDAQ